MALVCTCSPAVRIIPHTGEVRFLLLRKSHSLKQLFSLMLPLPPSALASPSGVYWSRTNPVNVSCQSSTSYLIIIKSLMPNVVASLFHDLTSPNTNPPAWIVSGHNWVTFVMLILVPLSFLRKLDSFRHTSYIAMFSVGELCR